MRLAVIDAAAPVRASVVDGAETVQTESRWPGSIAESGRATCTDSAAPVPADSITASAGTASVSDRLTFVWC